MTLKELKKKLMKRISVHPNMKLEWGGIFTFKVNIIIIKVDNGELCYIIQKKRWNIKYFICCAMKSTWLHLLMLFLICQQRIMLANILTIGL